MLIIPRLTELWPFKCQGHPVSLWRWPLTCNLESVIHWDRLLACNLERQLWYLHLLTRHCPSTCSRSQPLLNMNIEGNFEATLWHHRWCYRNKNFFGIIWDDLFISETKLKLCLIFQNFQNGRHFKLATKFFLLEVIAEVENNRQIALAFPTFWVFDRCSNSNIDGDILILKFDLLCDLVTSSMTSWICIYTNVVIISWYLCTGSLMISLLVFLVIMKNVVISFMKEYRGPTLRPTCDAIDGVIIMKNIYLA